jgi:hypothetical protein
VKLVFLGVEEATKHCLNVRDARYGEAVFNLLRCIRKMTRICAYARFSLGSLCFMTIKDA